MASPEKAKKMVEITNLGEDTKRFYRDSLSANLRQITAAFPHEVQGEVDAVTQKIAEVYDRHSSAIENMAEAAYIRSFSDQELDAIIRFLTSPEGSGFITRQANVVLDLDRELANYELQVIVPEIRAETMKMLEEMKKEKASEDEIETTD